MRTLPYPPPPPPPKPQPPHTPPRSAGAQRLPPAGAPLPLPTACARLTGGEGFRGIDLSGARGVLVLIAASKATFKLAESRNAMNTIRRYAAEDAHVIFGTVYDEDLGDQLRVTVIATV